MSKTNAERQAEYRARRAAAGAQGNGERRLSAWIDTGAALALERLARRSAVTQRQILERLIAEEEQGILAAMEPESSEWDDYFRRPPLRGSGDGSRSSVTR